jgi:hypothetical protein
VEANAAGIVTTHHVGVSSYDALSGGDPTWALQAITGYPASDFSVNSSDVASAWNAGKMVVLCTSTPASSYIVGDHCYAMVGYNPSSSQPFEIFNPWGTDANGWAPGQSGTIYGLFWASAPFLSQNFSTEAFGNGSVPIGNGGPGHGSPTGALPAKQPLADLTASGSPIDLAVADLASQMAIHRHGGASKSFNLSALDAVFSESAR